MHPYQVSTEADPCSTSTTGTWQSGGTRSWTSRSWHHYTGTYDGSYLRLYIDGVVVVERPVTGAIQADAGRWPIGYDDNSGRLPFAGDIAEVAVWSTARTLDEVSGDLYRSLAGSEPGLVGCWRMERFDHARRDQDPGHLAAQAARLLRGAPWTRRSRRSAIARSRRSATQRAAAARSAGSPRCGCGACRSPTTRSRRAHARCSRATSRGCSRTGRSTRAPARPRATRPPAARRTAPSPRADWAGCTANLGSPGSFVLGLPRSRRGVTCPAVPLAGASFTVELWARRSGASQSAYQ